jgi:hypothetical protein
MTGINWTQRDDVFIKFLEKHGNLSDLRMYTLVLNWSVDGLLVKLSTAKF